MTKQRTPDTKQVVVLSRYLGGLDEKGHIIKGADGYVHLDHITPAKVLAGMTEALEKAGLPMEGGVSPSSLDTLMEATFSMPLKRSRNGKGGSLMDLLAKHEQLRNTVKEQGGQILDLQAEMRALRSELLA